MIIVRSYSRFLRNMSTVCQGKRKAEEAEPAVSKHKKLKNVRNMERGDSEYYFEHGLRKVYPYNFTFYAFAKGRWIGCKVVDVYQKEFRATNLEKLRARFTAGLIRVDDQIISPDYVFKDNDLLTGTVHRHEIPVIGLPLKIVHEDNNVLVLDKPPSLPVHSCGRFHLNSVATILKKEHGIQDFHLCHRLDRLTSGLVITAKTRYYARKIIDQIAQRLVEKEYVCKVDGQFPEEEITCDKPLGTIDHRLGLQMVDEQNGKESLTIFKRISTNGTTSLVQCRPRTGRTHQIRVHLQYIGYPIVNDPLYNCSTFGPNKGKGGDYGEGTLEDLSKRIYEKHRYLRAIDSDDYRAAPLNEEEINKRHAEIDVLSESVNKAISEEWKEYMKSKPFDSTKLTFNKDCDDCTVPEISPSPSELFIHLHCLRYKGVDFDFKTDLPFWARD